VYSQSSIHNTNHSTHNLAYPNKCTGSKQVSRPLSEDGTEGNETLSIIAPKPPLRPTLKWGKEGEEEKKGRGGQEFDHTAANINQGISGTHHHHLLSIYAPHPPHFRPIPTLFLAADHFSIFPFKYLQLLSGPAVATPLRL